MGRTHEIEELGIQKGKAFSAKALGASFFMAILALEDGKVFFGEPFGAEGEICGEVVFNTCMTGYQEVLTDPSYKGQIVVMTHPLIGNYGINTKDLESSGPQVSGFLVREYSKMYSNWRAERSLEEFLKEHHIIALSEIDTRALTLHIREAGAMKGCVSTISDDPDEVIEKARASPSISEQGLVEQVSCKEIYEYTDKFASLQVSKLRDEARITCELDNLRTCKLHVVAYDFGIKYNILRSLKDRVKKITVVPAWTSAEEVLNLKPDGILLSNGPGDPERADYAIKNIQKLVERSQCPIFGICLGHQLLGLAFGARSYKLKFGHRGGNQPVKNLQTNKVEITTHNHGFAIRDLPAELEVTHVNLNDGTIEGMRHKELPIFSVQYHPEASPGPHDANYLFDRFVDLMQAYAQTHRH